MGPRTARSRGAPGRPERPVGVWGPCRGPTPTGDRGAARVSRGVPSGQWGCGGHVGARRRREIEGRPGVPGVSRAASGGGGAMWGPARGTGGGGGAGVGGGEGAGRRWG